MPEWKDIINYIFTFLNIIVTGVLTYLVFSAAKTNNKLVRAFSSEKPFLQLVSYDCSIEKFTLPRIQIKNVGPGHAVNIEVFTSLLKSDNKYTIVKLKGTNIIPYNQNEQNNVESYDMNRYDGENMANVGNIGRGASAIFYRHLLEYKKSGIPFIDKLTFIMLGAGVISRYIFPGASMNTIMYFTIYMLFLFSFQGKWGQELSKPFIYLIPYSSMSKLFYATLADLIKYTIDGLVLFTLAGIIFKSGVTIAILCALTYASFGAIYTYGDVLSRRMLGATHSKNLEIFMKMGITFLIVLPGIITFVILSLTSGGNSPMLYISYIVVICYNILASFLIMLLSRGIFGVLELN